MKTLLPAVIFLFSLGAGAQVPGQLKTIRMSCYDANSSPIVPPGPAIYAVSCAVNPSLDPANSFTGCTIINYQRQVVQLALDTQNVTTATYKNATYAPGYFSVVVSKIPPYEGFISSNMAGINHMLACKDFSQPTR